MNSFDNKFQPKPIELDCFEKALFRMNNSNEAEAISAVSKSENGVMKVTVLIAREPASQLVCDFMEKISCVIKDVEIAKETKNEPR